jgi:hypothetical protein
MKIKFLFSQRTAVCVLYHRKECGKIRMLVLTAAVLRDPEEGPPVLEKEKAIFVATSELEVQYLFLRAKG